jgi:hypothetical protein
MNSPPKEKRGVQAALKTAELLELYHVAAVYAKQLEQPYWFWESLRGRLADLLQNEGIDV